MPPTPVDPELPLHETTRLHGFSDQDIALFHAAYKGDRQAFENAVSKGANAHATDSNGLNALHLAIAHNDFNFARFLITQHLLPLIPDRFGRWPSILACQCRADQEFIDYIADHESEDSQDTT